MAPCVSVLPGKPNTAPEYFFCQKQFLPQRFHFTERECPQGVLEGKRPLIKALLRQLNGKNRDNVRRCKFAEVLALSVSTYISHRTNGYHVSPSLFFLRAGETWILYIWKPFSTLCELNSPIYQVLTPSRLQKNTLKEKHLAGWILPAA